MRCHQRQKLVLLVLWRLGLMHTWIRDTFRLALQLHGTRFQNSPLHPHFKIFFTTWILLLLLLLRLLALPPTLLLLMMLLLLLLRLDQITLLYQRRPTTMPNFPFPLFSPPHPVLLLECVPRRGCRPCSSRPSASPDTAAAATAPRTMTNQ